MNWIRARFLKIIALTYALLTGSAWAYAYPEAGQGKIEAAFLYLQPSVEDTYFVIDDFVINPLEFRPVDSLRINNDFDFHPGFRVGGVYRLCHGDRALRAHYTRLSERQRKLVAAEILWATVGSPDFLSQFGRYLGTAFSDLNILYQSVDGLLEQKIANICGLNIYLQGGFEYAYIRLQEHLTYFVTNISRLGEVTQNTFSNGIGPQLGFGIDYEICRTPCPFPSSLSISASTSGSILATRTCQSFGETLNDTPFNSSQDEPARRLISALHARLGLNCELLFPCWVVLFEIGYEYNSYYRAITRIAFTDDGADALCFTDYYNFNTQGLYLSLGMRF